MSQPFCNQHFDCEMIRVADRDQSATRIGGSDRRRGKSLELARAGPNDGQGPATCTKRSAVLLYCSNNIAYR